MEEYKKKIEELMRKAQEIARKENKLSGFTIGNTAKLSKKGYYLTPVRNTTHLVTAGVIVYSEVMAIECARCVDGRVDYILVDAEKKVPDQMSLSGEPANLERAVREHINQSKLWIYKGNDLAVDAVDTLITQLTKDELRGVGGKKVAILGVGNLGSKLALKLVERGANVFICRRNKERLDTIARALNYVKPDYTKAMVEGTTDVHAAAHQANILLGVTQGTPLITEQMIQELAPQAIVIDVGKGTLHPAAIKAAEARQINVYRLDITAAFEGLVTNLWMMENILHDRMGRKKIGKVRIVSGGLLGRKGEVVVDNIFEPQIVYGIANGLGDFIQTLDDKSKADLKVVHDFIESNRIKKETQYA